MRMFNLKKVLLKVEYAEIRLDHQLKNDLYLDWLGPTKYKNFVVINKLHF